MAKEEPVTAEQATVDEVEAVEGSSSTTASTGGKESEGKDREKKERKTGPGKKFVQDEERAVGNVKWETYRLYIVAATYTTWAWSLLILGKGSCTALSSDTRLSLQSFRRSLPLERDIG